MPRRALIAVDDVPIVAPPAKTPKPKARSRRARLSKWRAKRKAAKKREEAKKKKSKPRRSKKNKSSIRRHGRIYLVLATIVVMLSVAYGAWTFMPDETLFFILATGVILYLVTGAIRNRLML